MKFVEFANNFTKFVGLAKKFYEVCRSCEQLDKVWDSPVTFAKSARPSKAL